MKKTLYLLILTFLLSLSISALYGQGRFIRKIQEKAEDKAIEEIFKDKKNKTDENQQPGGNQQPGVNQPGYDESAPSARQRKAGGLNQTPPDVLKNIDDAQLAFKGQKFPESKTSIRQALWGVELEIGQNILKSLPESVEGLKMVKEEDRVTSSGVGFVGLIIERVYRGKDEMELKCMTGNDAALLGLAGMYLAGGMYVNSTDQTNQKPTRFKEHRAFIQFDEYAGYTLSVPFGQSSVFVVTGVNFDSEDHFMTAANNFDLDRIKKELGEQ